MLTPLIKTALKIHARIFNFLPKSPVQWTVDNHKFVSVKKLNHLTSWFCLATQFPILLFACFYILIQRLFSKAEAFSVPIEITIITGLVVTTGLMIICTAMSTLICRHEFVPGLNALIQLHTNLQFRKIKKYKIHLIINIFLVSKD